MCNPVIYGELVKYKLERKQKSVLIGEKYKRVYIPLRVFSI